MFSKAHNICERSTYFMFQLHCIIAQEASHTIDLTSPCDLIPKSFWQVVVILLLSSHVTKVPPFASGKLRGRASLNLFVAGAGNFVRCYRCDRFLQTCDGSKAEE